VPVIVLLVVLVVTGVGIILSVGAAEREHEAKWRAWQEAARELGLRFTRSRATYPQTEWQIEGVINGVPLRAEYRNRMQQTGNVRSTVPMVVIYTGRESGIPRSLVVHADSLGRAMSRLVDGRDEKIGDKSFDELVELPALDAYACAALSSAARKGLTGLVEQGGEVRQGVLVYERIAERDHNRAWLVQEVRFLAQLARRLSVTPSELHQRLTENAVADPSHEVRLTNLRHLADPGTRTPAPLLAATARKLLSDPHVPVRLLAAAQLGAEADPTLLGVASDRTLPLPRRVEALTAIGLRRPAGLDALLTKLLAQGPLELTCLALTTIGAQQLDTLSPAVVECAGSEHEAARIAAAWALGALSPCREDVLIRLLGDSSSDVQCASAESLGRCGSITAVEPLSAVANRLTRPQLRQAARAAIGQIQSRLGDVEAGRLSLVADDDRGQLALADAATPGGELSLLEGSEDPVVVDPALPTARRGSS
jgi:HEAT repeat protein